jgi:hypothetical protein
LEAVVSTRIDAVIAKLEAWAAQATEPAVRAELLRQAEVYRRAQAATKVVSSEAERLERLRVCDEYNPWNGGWTND